MPVMAPAGQNSRSSAAHEVVDERAECRQILAQRGQQARAGHRGVVQRTPHHPVAVLEVVDELEISRETARRPHQLLAFLEVEALAQRGRMRGGLPAARVVEDEVAHAALGFRFRMPQPGADEAFARLQVHVERGRGHFAATLMEQPRTLPGLVRRFIVGETRVTMDAEQRAADATGICAEMVAHLGQRRLKVAQQAQERLPHVVFVLLAVVVEPCLFVMQRQAAQEPEAGIGEIGAHRSSCRCWPQSRSDCSRAWRRASSGASAASASSCCWYWGRLSSPRPPSPSRRWRR